MQAHSRNGGRLTLEGLAAKNVTLVQDSPKSVRSPEFHFVGPWELFHPLLQEDLLEAVLERRPCCLGKASGLPSPVCQISDFHPSNSW